MEVHLHTRKKKPLKYQCLLKGSALLFDQAQNKIWKFFGRFMCYYLQITVSDRLHIHNISTMTNREYSSLPLFLCLHLKGLFNQKWIFLFHLVNLKLFQTCMICFYLWNTKYNILNNTGVQKHLTKTFIF